MNLLDRLKLECAASLDRIKGIAERAGSETVVSIVVSHPGTAEDAFTVGEHDLPDLFAILARLETGGRVECDVTSTGVGPNEPIKKGTVQ